MSNASQSEGRNEDPHSGNASSEAKEPIRSASEAFRQVGSTSAGLDRIISSSEKLNEALRSSMQSVNQDALQSFRKGMQGFSQNLRSLQSASQQMAESIERVSKHNRGAFRTLRSSLEEMNGQIMVQNQAFHQINTSTLQTVLAGIDTEAFRQIETSIAGMLEDVPPLNSRELLEAIRTPGIAELSKNLRFSLNLEGVPIDVASILDDALSGDALSGIDRPQEEATAPESTGGHSEEAQTTFERRSDVDAEKVRQLLRDLVMVVAFFLAVKSHIDDQQNERLLRENRQRQEKILQGQEAEEGRDSIAAAKLDTLIEVGKKIQPYVKAHLAKKRLVTEQVTLREGPDIEASTLATMEAKTVVELTEEAEGWAKVSYSSGDTKETGWVRDAYLEAPFEQQ